MGNTKNIIIATLIAIILLMAVGYSAFATQLTINGTAQIIGEWNVKITNIQIQNISEGCNGGTPEYTNTTATLNGELIKPGDSITYEITIQNAGTIDAKLSKIKLTADDINGSPALKYTNTEPATNLAAGEQTTFTITVVYDADTTEVPEIKTKTITGIIEYVQK